MIRFECDYGEGAAQPVLDLLQKTNLEQTPGYGEDEYCEQARALIRRLCAAPQAGVHFFVGATQANLTVIDAALKPWQGVLCPQAAFFWKGRFFYGPHPENPGRQHTGI